MLDESETPCRRQSSKAPEGTAVLPVKLVLPGEYWDTQIYQGRLYLFARDGSIATLNWDELIDSVIVPESLRLALICAFKRSDYFYRVADIFYDPEIREVVSKRFDTLSGLNLVVDPVDQEQVLVSRQDNPFPFPHADSTIYRRQLFVASTNGVFTSDCTRRRKRAISNDVDKLWDAPISSIEASWGSLALAGGDEGLWEYDLGFDFDSINGSESPSRIAKQHCSECHWAYYSIFGSSLKGPGFLAAYRKIGGSREPERQLEGIILDSELFDEDDEYSESYSWAAQDKICLIHNGSIKVAKYKPSAPEPEDRFRLLGTIPLERHGEDIVTARVALFGTVVELDSSIVVIASDSSTFHVAGEPVSWRVFPRSRHYENHLHICYEDRLEILSFNHDYQVPQSTKLSGISVSLGARREAFGSALLL